MSHIVTLETKTFCPTLNMDRVSIADARELADFLSSLNTIVNAAIKGCESGDVVQYLDDWQALLHEGRSHIVEAIAERNVSAPGEVAERSWAITHLQIDTAMGPMFVTGENNSEIDDQVTKAFLSAGDGK